MEFAVEAQKLLEISLEGSVKICLKFKVEQLMSNFDS
jgi:hypothetical protein